MKIYNITYYYEQGDLYRKHLIPKELVRIIDALPPRAWYHLLVYKYLLLHKKEYINTELDVLEKKSNKRLDVEYLDINAWLTSQRFKDFSEQEKLSLDFFPVLVEGERRYIAMKRRLPVISDYEADIKKSEYYEPIGDGTDNMLRYEKAVFRSDVLEYYQYNMFDDTMHIYSYITDTLKQKFDEQGFRFTYKEMPTTQKKLDKKQVEKDLVFAREMERKLYLIDWRKQKLQEVDDYLEKILTEEGDKNMLEKFRNEMKGEWKKDFERYEKGLMKPLEKIIYW